MLPVVRSKERSQEAKLRVAAAVAARREELGPQMGSIRRAANVAGIAEQTWANVEKGETNWSDDTELAMCKALRWLPGAFERITRDELPIQIGADVSMVDLFAVAKSTDRSEAERAFRVALDHPNLDDEARSALAYIYKRLT